MLSRGMGWHSYMHAGTHPMTAYDESVAVAQRPARVARDPTAIAILPSCLCSGKAKYGQVQRVAHPKLV